MDYQKQANDFAKKHGITLKIKSSEYKKHFIDDKEQRYVFRCQLICNKKSYTFSFGQSIAFGSKKPTMYDILTCMTKHDPGSFENFCSEYGYDTDSIKASKIYTAVCREFEAMERLFTEEILEEMQEIQ